MTNNDLDRLSAHLANRFPELEICALIGSRARGDAHPDSDWDFAIQWAKAPNDTWSTLTQTETLRLDLANWLSVPAEGIDLVELPTAGLAMRAAVAEEGLPLVTRLPWFHFLSRTWRDLEEHYWNDVYAA